MGYVKSDQEEKKRNSDPFLEDRKGSIKERLVQLKKGRTNRQLADDWGVPLSTLTGYINRGSTPPVDTAFSIAVKEGVSIEWLVTGNDASNSQERSPSTVERIVELPKYNIAASAGGGTFVDMDTTVEYMPFSYNFLKRNRLSHASLYILEARGDSMEGLIHDGAELLVKEIREMPEKPFDGTYVISLDNQLKVKNLEYSLTRDGYRILSENELYPEEFVPRSELEQRLRVLGEVAIVMGKPSKGLSE